MPVVAFIMLLIAVVVFVVAALHPTEPRLTPLGLVVLVAGLICEFARLGPGHHF